MFQLLMFADVDMGNKRSGTPLLQMMMYAIILPKPKELQMKVLDFFIDNNAVLTRVLTTGLFSNAGVLEMSLCLTRFNFAEKLVFEHHLDPIYGGNPAMKPIFVEYDHFGTDRFIKSILRRYGGMGKTQVFIECLLHPGVFSEELQHTFTVVNGRNPYHPFLLSGDKAAIECLVSRKDDVLEEHDQFGRTALHLAAEQGNKESVEILLNL